MADEEKKLDESLEITEELTAADKTKEIQVEKKLEEMTEDRLTKTFVEGKKLEPSPESPKESSDSTPKSESADDDDDEDGPTASEKKEEARLEAEEAKAKVEKDKEDTSVSDTDSKAKDEEAQTKDKDKGEGVPQLCDAYVRAAIHRGWSEDDVKDLYKHNPKLAIATLGKIYEEVNRASQEFAAIGRQRKEQQLTKSTQKEKGTEQKTEFKGLDIEALRRQYPDDPITDMVEVLQTQNKMLYDQIQGNKTGSAPVTDQPSSLDLAQTRAVQQESAAIQQQIETFFRSDVLKGYDEFYGKTPDNAINWDALTPGQKMNRFTVIEMMDQMVVGAHSLGRKMEIGEALKLAHLSVTETIREKVIRDDLKSKIVKRSKNLSLTPSGTAQSGDTKPRSKQELEVVTAERLKSVLG